MFALLIIICIGLWTGEQSRQADSIRSIESEISQSDSQLVEQVASVGPSLGRSDIEQNLDDPKPVPSPSDKPSKPEIIIFTSPLPRPMRSTILDLARDASSL